MGELPPAAPPRVTLGSRPRSSPPAASSAPTIPRDGSVNKRRGSKVSLSEAWEDSERLQHKANAATHGRTGNAQAAAYAGLSRTSSIDAALAAENQALREELDRWRRAGATVAEREAKVVGMLKQASQHAAGGQSHSEQPALIALETGSDQAKAQRYKSAVTLQLAFVMAFLALTSLTSLFYCFSSKDMVGQLKGNAIARTWRESGLQSYVIEFSEIQIGTLPTAGDVYIALHGGGKDFLTKPVETPTNGLLRFPEVITFSMTPSPLTAKGSCKLVVIDRETEERLAHLEIPAHKLLRLVNDDHREYFHFDLALDTHRLKARFYNGTRRPSVAMRIRDVTGLAAPDTCTRQVRSAAPMFAHAFAA